ncbi:condensation domain-containing protein [Paenibacillus amylolyticus]|nr:condensation domain-containing protein [Paenibacillus amylolyticus]
MVLLAAYTVMLSKYSGQEDLIVGTPVAGRTNADLEPVIGMFVNTLALRNRPSGEKRSCPTLMKSRKRLWELLRIRIIHSRSSWSV